MSTKNNQSLVSAVNRRVNQQVQNYKTCLKNLRLGVEKFNFSVGEGNSFVALRFGTYEAKT